METRESEGCIRALTSGNGVAIRTRPSKGGQWLFAGAQLLFQDGASAAPADRSEVEVKRHAGLARPSRSCSPRCRGKSPSSACTRWSDSCRTPRATTHPSAADRRTGCSPCPSRRRRFFLRRTGGAEPKSAAVARVRHASLLRNKPAIPRARREMPPDDHLFALGIDNTSNPRYMVLCGGMLHDRYDQLAETVSARCMCLAHNRIVQKRDNPGTSVG
jgi:hypothetical protein